MISSTLGAFFGGTTRGAHHDVDSEAFCWITPPNFGSGGGNCWPLIVVVALGAPRVPVTCCAVAEPRHAAAAIAAASPWKRAFIVSLHPLSSVAVRGAARLMALPMADSSALSSTGLHR